MKVRDVMATDILTIDEFTTVDSAIKIMQDKGVQSLLIEPLDKKDSYGIITEIDILYKVVAKGHDPETLCVRDIMTKPCIEIKPDLDIQSVAQLFVKTGICSAPIVQKKIFSPKKLLGIVSVSDLIPKSKFSRQFSDTRELLKVDDKLTDYQRLRSQGAISTYSTRILDKIPQEKSPTSTSDSTPQPQPSEDFPDTKTPESEPKKSSKQDKEQLTDYQRLRAQGSISAYSTRILDKMPPQEQSSTFASDSTPQPEQKDNSSEPTTSESESKKSSKPPQEDQFTDYQRLRFQGAISRYSTRILDKMPQDPKDD